MYIQYIYSSYRSIYTGSILLYSAYMYYCLLNKQQASEGGERPRSRAAAGRGAHASPAQTARAPDDFFQILLFLPRTTSTT